MSDAGHSRREFFGALFGRQEDDRPVRRRAREVARSAPVQIAWQAPRPGPAPVAADAAAMVAHIARGRCMPFCSVCQERCPVTGAIVFDVRAAGFVVRAEKCTGCGDCTRACPSPEVAVTLVRR